MVLAWCCWRQFCFVGTDFHPVFSRCFLQSMSELLQFFFAAYEQIDVVGKTQVAKRSSSNGHWWQRSVSFFCLFYCIICKAVILRWIVSGTFALYSPGPILNNNGDNRHPYRISSVVRKNSQHLHLVALAQHSSLHRTTTYKWVVTKQESPQIGGAVRKAMSLSRSDCRLK